MRLINGDELLEFVEDRYEITWESDSYEGGIKDACTDIIEKIGTMPTIEPEPKMGKWIGGELGYCTCCGHEGCASDMWDRCEHPHCPNCGAEMEKE